METFGERLRRIREAQGLRQRELGQRAEMDPAQVSRYERGVIREPSTDVLARLARGLAVTVTELRDGTDRRTPELADLRDAVSRVRPLGSARLSEFVRRVVILSEEIARRS